MTGAIGLARARRRAGAGMKALEIARINMVRTFRDRMSLFFILVLPMILIVVLGMTYGGMSTARVGVADEDGGPLAADLATAMTRDDRCASTSGGSPRATQLREAVERGFVELGIVIHHGLRRRAPQRRHGVGRVRQPAAELRQRDPDRARRDDRRPGRARSRAARSAVDADRRSPFDAGAGDGAPPGSRRSAGVDVAVRRRRRAPRRTRTATRSVPRARSSCSCS